MDQNDSLFAIDGVVQQQRCHDGIFRQPDPLSVGVGIDLDVAHSWSKILFTGHLGDDVEIGWRERFDLQHRQSDKGSTT